MAWVTSSPPRTEVLAINADFAELLEDVGLHLLANEGLMAHLGRDGFQFVFVEVFENLRRGIRAKNDKQNRELLNFRQLRDVVAGLSAHLLCPRVIQPRMAWVMFCGFSRMS
jgi:hypothetical protein